MATGTIDMPLKIETDQATPWVNFSKITKNRITKIGKIRILEFCGVLSSSVSSWTPFIRLPSGSGIADHSEVQFCGILNDNADVMALVHETSYGTYQDYTVITTKNSAGSGQKIAASLVYIAED